MPTYTVELELGAWSATIDAGDVPAPADPVYVLDGASLSWRYAGETRPGQLEPVAGRVQLATRDVAELAGLDLDQPARIRFETSTGTVFASLDGTIAALDAAQTLRAGEVWTVYSVAVTDHTATTNVPVTASLPDHNWITRLEALAASSGVAIRPPWDDGAAVPPTAYSLPGVITAADVQGDGLLDLVRRYLPQIVTVPFQLDPDDREPPPPPWFYLLAPITDATTGALELLALHALSEPVAASSLPAVPAVAGGLWSLELLDVPNAVPAGRVELASGSWRKGRETQATHVTLRFTDSASLTVPASSWAPGDPVHPRELTTDLTSLGLTTADEYGPIAEAYLRLPADAGWSREGLIYRVADPDDLAGFWFPHWTDANYSTDPDPTILEDAADCFRVPVAVGGIPDAANLAGAAGTYAGLLRAVTVTIAAGEVLVGFELLRVVPPVADDGDAKLATWSWLRTTYPTVATSSGATVLDPSLTYADLKLIRRP